MVVYLLDDGYTNFLPTRESFPILAKQDGRLAKGTTLVKEWV